MKKTTTINSYVFPYLDAVKITCISAQSKFLTFFIYLGYELPLYILLLFYIVLIFNPL